MRLLLELFENNPWLNLVSFTLAILGIVVSVFLYLRGTREKRPCFKLHSFPLIKKHAAQIRSLEVFHKGVPLKSLTLTKVALWNRGRQVINRDDVAPADPMRIVISPPGRLLDAEVKFKKNQANNFSLTSDFNQNVVSIDFDYFGTHEGIVLNIYHTGVSDESIMVLGTFKGVTSISRAKDAKDYYTDSAIDRIWTIVEPIAGWPNDDRLKKCLGMLFRGVLMFMISPFAIIDILTRPIRKVPKEYTLE